MSKVKDQYEDYPYPPIDEDNMDKVVSIIGENLRDLNHWLYGGTETFKNNFRVLIAGGGTGDSVIYMATQLKNTNAEIIYLDFSRASMEIAQKRAKILDLNSITWIHDSILNIPNLNLGKFDYINCIGVLHHLENPPKGLEILKDCLTPTGAINLMVYGKIGRTGIYQMQDLLRLVNVDARNKEEEIMTAKAFLNNLPRNNWFSRGGVLDVADHVTFGDVGIYDLFLHKQDVAYTVLELHTLVEQSGLKFVEYSDPTERVKLDIKQYLSDVTVINKVKKLGGINEHYICELLVGDIIKHQVYLTNNINVASFGNKDLYMVFSGIANPSKFLNDYIPAEAISGSEIKCRIDTPYIKERMISFRLVPYVKTILTVTEDTSISLGEMYDKVRETLGIDVDNENLSVQFNTIFKDFIKHGVLSLNIFDK